MLGLDGSCFSEANLSLLDFQLLLRAPVNVLSPGMETSAEVLITHDRVANPTINSTIQRVLTGIERISSQTTDRRPPVSFDVMRHLNDEPASSTISNDNEAMH